MARTRTPLPPAPDEVPLPATFGDWYDLAAVHLGVAERRDSGASRLFAGLLLVLACTLGLGVFAGPQLAVLVGGADGSADVATLVLGLVLTAGALAGWFRYRRAWVAARRLRRAWGYALRDPRVLELPVRSRPASGPDPEDQHHYRARRHAELAPYPGVRSVGGVTGFLDFLRAVFYPVALMAGVLVVVVGLGQDDPAAAVTTVLSGLPLTVAALCASVRAWWRLGESWRLVGLQNDDLHRWSGWRVLHGLGEPLGAPSAARRALLLLPVALGGLLVVVARAGSGSFGVGDVVLGVAVVVVPAAAVALSFRVRAARARSGGEGLAVRVLADDVPAQGPVVVPPGDARLVLADGRAAVAGVDAAAVALITGAPQMLATRRHFLVLADGSQAQLSCADVAGLRAAATAAGLRVL